MSDPNHAELTRTTFDRAISEGRQPQRWEMTIAAYRNLLRDLGEEQPRELLVGQRVPNHLGIPILIRPGAPVQWELIVKGLPAR